MPARRNAPTAAALDSAIAWPSTFSSQDSTVPTTLRPALAKLAADPTSANSRRLWKAMTIEERRQGMEAMLASESEDQMLRAGLRAEIAKARKFRPQVLARWDDAQLAEAGARLDIGEKGIAWDALMAHLLRNRTAMLVQFLDYLGIPHEAGLFSEDLGKEPLTAARLRAAAASLQESFAADDVAIYLLALRSSQPPFAELGIVLQEMAQEG